MEEPTRLLHPIDIMFDQLYSLSHLLAFFLLGTLFGRRILLMMVPELFWKHYTAKRLLVSLPEIRRQIDELEKVDWSTTRFISVMNSDVGIVGVICNNKNDKGEPETKAYLKNFNGRWEQI